MPFPFLLYREMRIITRKTTLIMQVKVDYQQTPSCHVLSFLAERYIQPTIYLQSLGQAGSFLGLVRSYLQ